MRKLFILISILISSIVGYSQSYDDKIANAINAGDWFALDSIYRSAPKGGLETFIQQYASLAGFDTYKIKMDGVTGRIPFKIVHVGKPEDEGLHIHLEESFLNGIPAEITFDTGAAANVISASLVEKLEIDLF